MSFLDKILNRKPKIQKDEQIVVENETHATQSHTETQPKLDLSKKIGLNFSKMNLDDENVRKKRVFLLDVSGSMDDEVHDVRKIDSLRDAMSKYKDSQKVCFSSGVSRCQRIAEPSGTTDLDRALRFIKSEFASNMPERIVLVSDGEPDSKSNAREAAFELKIPIDIIFIGEEKSEGQVFMEELAELTGGQHFVV